jgi:hypothetical protein
MSIRRSAAGLALIVTFAGSATAVAAAPAHADAGGSAYCRTFVQFYPWHFIGPCTSYFQSHDLAGVAANTEYFCKINFIPVGEFATVGECVNAFNSTGP